MSLRWDWNEKVGELILENGTVIDLYNGNAYLIMIREYQEDGKDMYQMWSFWADKQHMKNCLGLNKRGHFTENLFEDCHIAKFRFSKACRNLKDIMSALVDAFDNINMEVYTDE